MSNAATPSPGEPFGTVFSSGGIMGRAIRLIDVDNVASVVLAAVATEANLVELVTSAANSHPKLVAECPRLAVLAQCLSEQPGANAGAVFRFQLARLALSGTPFDQGTEPFQGLDTLVRLRNRLVHPIPEPANGEGFIRDASDARIVAYLKTRDLVRDDPQMGRVSRYSMTGLVDSPTVSRWACRKASEVVQALVASIPRSNFRTKHEFLLRHPWIEDLPADVR